LRTLGQLLRGGVDAYLDPGQRQAARNNLQHLRVAGSGGPGNAALDQRDAADAIDE
jgi:hypothetical protein